MNGHAMSANPHRDPTDINQRVWDQTAAWTNYDYSLMRILEESPNLTHLAEWVRTAHFLEPLAAAREFGHTVTMNPERR